MEKREVRLYEVEKRERSSIVELEPDFFAGAGAGEKAPAPAVADKNRYTFKKGN